MDQSWEPIVLEQWAAAIATPCLRTAHMGLTGPHNVGTEVIKQEAKESQRVWLSHAKAREGLNKARVGPGAPWCGPCGNYNRTNKQSGSGYPERL